MNILINSIHDIIISHHNIHTVRKQPVNYFNLLPLLYFFAILKFAYNFRVHDNLT